MKRLVSGIQPSGQLHIGNYLGAIKQWLELQDDYDCFFFIANDHALTARLKPQDLKEQTFHVAAMLIALGLDPKKSQFFAQSEVSQHTELAWILSSFASVGELMRMTQFKDKTSTQAENAGLFTYPILMAADVLLYDAEVVPVGEDQVQHLELTREIARRFNNHYEALLTEPKPLLNKTARVMSLADPTRKMSKSLPGGAIGLLDDAETIERTIKRAVTDSDPHSKELSPALANLFSLLEGFGQPDTVKHFGQLQQNGQLKYSELKAQISEDLIAFLKPVQKTYHQLVADPDSLLKMLTSGAEQARLIAKAKIYQVKAGIGLL